jgi:hypothetical protein
LNAHLQRNLPLSNSARGSGSGRDAARARLGAPDDIDGRCSPRGHFGHANAVRGDRLVAGDKENETMTTKILKRLLAGAAVLAATAALAPAAWAGCGVDPTKAPASWQVAPGAAANPLLTKIALSTPPIVGLWSVSFHSGGHVIDFGYQAWHSDGTEILNSGGRSPASENFCLGAWAQTAANRYALNHFALSYDPATGMLNAKVNIKESVGLNANGSQFFGSFTFNVTDPKTGALLQSVSGTIIGNRMTAF